LLETVVIVIISDQLFVFAMLQFHTLFIVNMALCMVKLNNSRKDVNE